MEFGFDIRVTGSRQVGSEWVGPQDLWISKGSSEVFAGERVLTSALWRVANPQLQNVA